MFLTAEMPGVSGSDAAIDLQGQTLEISGTVDFQLPEGFQDQPNTPPRRKYSRQFTLPDSIDRNNITALMKDGVLRLTLPKVKAAVPRKIAVQGA
ncbi:MAG: Hsp20 family protein [Oligosphaeraceae bacterium]|nr:Hsp20 family protein [Oligosphaeraceae bacterium]